MNNRNIKKLAIFTIGKNKINKRIAKLALNNLSRKDLALYAVYLKKIVYENSIKIISGSALPQNTRYLLKKKFKDKNVFFETNESVGDGIKAVIGDTITDLSLKGYIDNTLEILSKK